MKKLWDWLRYMWWFRLNHINWSFLWKAPLIAVVLFVIGYGVLNYLADRDCIKYGGRGYVVFPRYFCTRIEDGDELFLRPEVLKNANPGQSDPMRSY